MKSPEAPMPDDLAAITDVEELHAMEQMTQHTIYELMKHEDETRQQLQQMAERKRQISRRIVQILAVEFDAHHREPTPKGVK